MKSYLSAPIPAIISRFLATAKVCLIPLAPLALMGASSAADADSHSLTEAERLKVTQQVHALILKKQAEEKSAQGEAPAKYQEEVPLAGKAKLEMLPIPGGEFMLGSAPTEAGRKTNEGPQKKVKIEPFWMSKVEIPWKFYTPYYQNGKARKSDGSLRSPNSKDSLSTIICQPTPQYHDMFLNNSFENNPDFPAMDMTQHAANKFCQWLSAQTGHFYRLPTEAEWEYACRAGTTTAWSFGDDASMLDDYAWYEGNSNFTYQKVGLKKANPWGLHDMHGNVAEWVLDQFNPKFYDKIKAGESGPWNPPVTRYPRSIRGGSWDSSEKDTRSATRIGSNKMLKGLDPQVPKSVWYHTGGQHIGFRIIRPVKVPSAEEMHRYWNSDWWSPERNAEDL